MMPSVRVVVLAGRGKSFSAGADLNWMKRAARLASRTNLRDARDAGADAAEAGGTCRSRPSPRVHGAALGGGMGLVAACDIASRLDGACFATSEVRLGLIPATIAPYVMRAIGSAQASRYFLTAERIDARERAGNRTRPRGGGGGRGCTRPSEPWPTHCSPAGRGRKAAAKALIRDMAGTVDDRRFLVEDTARRIAVLRRRRGRARHGRASTSALHRENGCPPQLELARMTKCSTRS